MRDNAMPTVVRARIVKIGNSRGIRIPKVLLEQGELGEEVELELEQGQIVIRPVRAARDHWESAFQAMRAQGDDTLLDGDANLSAAWEEVEWEW
jgi:antitoxin MazE